MKIFLSPAKRLNEDPDKVWSLETEPRFMKQAAILMESLKEMSPKDLMNLMKISNDLAQLNYERNQMWQKNPNSNQALTAGLMFDGEVYRGFRETPFTADQLDYLSKHVYILSGLYGILSPTDLIMPYRLEMGTKLPVKGLNDLHEFWKETLTKYVNDNTQEGEILLNLASKEYMNSIDTKKLHGRIVDFKFKDYKNGELKQITVYMKKARGEMANWCIQNKANSLDDLKRFDRMGYQYDDNLSNEKTLIYTR
ncbi:MAG: peroxide stress protein YaaA [Weeksellaceae bacterium]